MLYHAYTGTGRPNDWRITFREGMHEIQCNRPCLLFKAIIEERLSAAGLFWRKNQFHPQSLQNASHILKRGSVELVTEAGNEKLGFWH
jgi:hypothetical protein